ncbi:histidinol-phosphate transaminase [Candidatus Halobeggiatoa sp. HSG11]|nr:histidinol-phosphate transaminase [Candidatus Halobeggiatoa sp. HSG11]
MSFLELATSGVQGLRPYQPGKPIEELKREYGITNVIKLASNENPLGPSPLVLEAIQANLAELSRYPDGNGFELKQAIANKYDVEMDTITLGNGSNDILELIARAFVTSQQSVIFSAHAFAVYPLVTQAIGAKMIITPAITWGHDLTAMREAICDDTRLIFIANPNNPTGTWLDKDNLQNFLESVPNNVIVVVDEAYYEYACKNPNYPNSLEWLKTYPNLIVTRTFSKAYGLAGLRVGYSISHPQVTNLLNRVRQPFNVNNLALVAGTVALSDSEYLDKSIELNRIGMRQLENAFNDMNLSYIPSLGNFLAVEVGNGAKINEALLTKGVITRPIDVGYGMPHHLRISVGTEAENTICINALKQVLSDS